ncbi:prepilin-type N-terminal cleavage/methylation domain-containing protein [Thermodesulforhabdus norvegica]|uniref:Prepilin-type N-terminal cleavage/methylation domain-containing protein n=1 Tax=Thermodesulforhabdus norvegica TaxID=39841 RepID=A0A1I4SRF2_9BACT|nr:prepilin-type N-terminal cleavage/methylation domain-containing protein [Thermodesulforhabdus norvegica]SFM67098.1 prepilin-type N-terminal cleavage/methylation domain-containing protein [Thermodesulforhabdus norvegica]
MNKKGFTLVEVLVALVIAVLVVGSAMALIGGVYQSRYRLDRRMKAIPVLDAAAQAIFRDPSLVHEDSIVLKELPGSPVVYVVATRVNDGEIASSVALYRVKLRYEDSEIEFSVVSSEE